MISAMGDLEGKGKGGFVLLDEISRWTTCLSVHKVLVFSPGVRPEW